MKSETSLEGMTMPISDSEVFYKTLLENTFDGIGIIDFDGSVKYHSSPIKNILGYDGEFKKIANIFELIHPDDIESFKLGLGELKNNPDYHRAITARFRHHDETWRYLATRLNNLSHDPAIRGVIISYRDITHKQLLRKSIDESEERYRSLIENSFDGITIVNFDGIVKYHSPSLLRILGYRPESGMGKSILDLLHPDDLKIFYEAQQHWKKWKSKTFKGTVRFKHKNESWVVLEIRAMDLTDKPGIEGFLINYRDITERAELESALLQSESRYKNLATASPVGIFTTDSEGNCTFVNEKWCKMSGLTFEESLGKGWSKCIHPEDIPKVFDNWAKAVAKRQASHQEYRLCTPDGRIAWVYCQTLPEIDSSENITGYIGSVTDISERVKMEKALQESGELYRTIVESAPEAIFIVDVEKCKFVDFNENAGRLFGYSREKLLKMNAIDLCPPMQPDGKSSQELAKEKIGEALAGAKPVYELQYKDAKGRLFMVEERLVRFPPYDRKLVLGTAVDISERKKMKQALHDSEERYRNMVENAQETIFVIDAETDKIVDFNENAEKLFGYSRSKLLGMKVSELYPASLPNGENAVKLAQEKAREALKKGKTFFEWWHKKANGKIYPTEVHLSRFPPFDRKLLRGTVIDISAKKEIERKMREQELQYKHLATVSPVGIFRTDSKGKTVYVNEKWCVIAGISESMAKGEGWMKAVHPDDRLRVQKEWKTSLKQKKVSRLEFRFLTPKGKTHWVIGEAVPDFDERGNFRGFAGSITDISERVKTEQALAKSEQRNSVLLNSIPDMIFRLSKNGTLLDCKVASNFKPIVPPEVVLGKKVKEVLPPLVADLCMKNIRLALKTNKIQTYSYSLPERRDTTKLNYFEARIVAYDSNEALALIRDITQQKEAELSLKASEERWRSLVKSAPQHIVTINGKDQLNFINKPRNVPVEKLKGVNVFDLARFFNIDVRPLKRTLRQARKGIHKSLEISVKDERGNDIWFNVISAPIKHNGKIEDLIVMALDITDLKRADQELRQTNEKLKALYQRLETIREEEKKNIAMEIHDQLGQELTALKLGMFWLEQHFERQHDKPDVRQIQQKIKSLIELSSQSIISVRKLAHQLRPIVLDNLGLIPAIEWQVEKANENGNTSCIFKHNIRGKKFAQEFSVALFRIVQESLTNILRHSNATKASVGLAVVKNKLTLTVKDNGIGITAKDMKQPGKIGIFGMKERVQTWNGHFEVKGSSGKGTAIKINFPLKSILKGK